MKFACTDCNEYTDPVCSQCVAALKAQNEKMRQAIDTVTALDWFFTDYDDFRAVKAVLMESVQIPPEASTPKEKVDSGTR
jgi:hypothetical protein